MLDRIKRRQYFELQDYKWLPSVIRDGVTDCLGFALSVINFYTPSYTFVLKMLGNNFKIVDLCSGTGAPGVDLAKNLVRVKKDLHVTLTDLYPNIPAFEAHQKEFSYINFEKNSLNVCDLKCKADTVYTLYSSFHHLPDEVAKTLLKNCFETKTSIGIFEFSAKSWFTLFGCVAGVINTFFFAPFVRPFKFSRLFFIYIIPLIPLVSLIDVVMSIFRTRTVREMQAMVAQFQSPDYQWEIGEITSCFGMKLPYLVGHERKKTTNH